MSASNNNNEYNSLIKETCLKCELTRKILVYFVFQSSTSTHRRKIIIIITLFVSYIYSNVKMLPFILLSNSQITKIKNKFTSKSETNETGMNFN